MTAAPSAAVLPSIPVRAGVPCLEQPCSACCHDIEMILTEDDLHRIRTARPDENFWFEADDGYLQLRTRDGPPARGAHAAPGAIPRPCIFLDADGRCGIHDIRPEGCRLYPALWDEDLRAAELDRDYCPYTEGFLLAPAIRDAARRLAQRLQAERARRVSGRGNP